MQVKAPWWNDLQRATSAGSPAGTNISKGEVASLIRPHAEQLKNDPEYRAAVERLLDTQGTEPHVTRSATNPLRKLLNETSESPKHTFKAHVLEAPTYSAGVGIMPAEPEPDRIYGPRVRLHVQFNEGTAEAVTRVENDPRARVLNVQGRRVPVVGTLTVFVHGESDALTRVRTMPKEFDVAAPLIAQEGPGQGGTYALVVRDGDPNGRNAVLRMTTFEVGGLPM